MGDSINGGDLELSKRVATATLRLAAARANVSCLQEQALMLVPEALLPQVGAGTVENFKQIHRTMEADALANLADLTASLANIEALVGQTLDIAKSD